MSTTNDLARPTVPTPAPAQPTPPAEPPAGPVYFTGILSEEEVTAMMLEVLGLPWLRRLAGRLRLTEDDLEEVRQNAVVGALRNRQRLRPDRDPRGYLARIGQNEIYNVTRGVRAGVYSLHGRDGLLAFDPPSGLPSPVEQVLAWEREQRLRQAVEALPARSRRIAEGRLEGESNAAIAEELGCTPEAVACSWHRLRKALTEALAKGN